MALPLPPGLTPNEVGFLCEMELVTVIPRSKLDGLELLGGRTAELRPPFPTQMPLWLALLLKRQQKCNVVPPSWLSVDALTSMLELETDNVLGGALAPGADLQPPTGVTVPGDPYLSQSSLEMSAPFIKDSSTSRAQDDALPYHWLELSHLLLSHASDDFNDPDTVRRLVRDLREVRMSKLRKGYRVLEASAALKINGVGGMEVAETRGFIGGVVDGLRRINKSKEEARRERMEEEGDGLGSSSYQDDDDEMQL